MAIALIALRPVWLCHRRWYLLQGQKHLASGRLQSQTVEKQWLVSSHGRVCNTKGVISYGCLKLSGYCQVQICGSNFYVHRLVVFAFLGPPPTQDAWQVHHRDGHPSNNNMDNLEYVTNRQNVMFSYARPSRRTTSLPVMWKAPGSQSWTTSASMTNAATRLGMHLGTVSRACSQQRPAKGIEFQLVSRKEIDVLEREEWRPMYDPISGATVPGRLVSSLGRIQSKTGRITWGHLTNTGYHATKLSLSSYIRHELVHRLVAFAFLGPPLNPHQYQVNHKDMDKSNNAV